MSYLIRSALFIACVAAFSFLWPEGSGAQQFRGRDVIRNVVRPIRPVNQDWQLGVHADNTRTGMRITSVVRGSAAARAGLAQGDKIIAVGNERVGFVGNHTVPMRKVLRRQADFQGNVVLLVKSRRNRGLVNVSVRLDRVGGSQIFSN